MRSCGASEEGGEELTVGTQRQETHRAAPHRTSLRSRVRGSAHPVFLLLQYNERKVGEVLQRGGNTATHRPRARRTPHRYSSGRSLASPPSHFHSTTHTHADRRTRELHRQGSPGATRDRPRGLEVSSPRTPSTPSPAPLPLLCKDLIDDDDGIANEYASGVEPGQSLLEQVEPLPLYPLLPPSPPKTLLKHRAHQPWGRSTEVPRVQRSSLPSCVQPRPPGQRSCRERTRP